MAANRAAFSLRRRRALGFSKRLRSRNCFKVCSRSNFFLSRRIARSTGSPFFSFISVIIQIGLVHPYRPASIGGFRSSGLRDLRRSVGRSGLGSSAHRLGRRLAQIARTAHGPPVHRGHLHPKIHKRSEESRSIGHAKLSFNEETSRKFRGPDAVGRPSAQSLSEKICPTVADEVRGAEKSAILDSRSPPP